jgi:ribosomal protein S12 methylthiotransferase accessory factor
MLEIDLRSGIGLKLLAALAVRHGDAIAKAAGMATRLFLLQSHSAPGLRFVGGEVDAKCLPLPVVFQRSFSLAGSAELLEDALASCLGEGVERLSQVARPGDVVRECPYHEAVHQIMPAALPLIESLLERCPHDRATPVAFLRGRALASDRETLVPADWCLRRPISGPLGIPGAALSTGCAAGASFEAAAARALLELVERDAAAIWWIGGRRPRPLSAESAEMAETVRLLRGLRPKVSDRTSWLLEVTTDLAIPCMAAVSVDATGRGLACGLAARLAPEQAARAAVLEMCQMELALQVVEAKRRQRGEQAFNEVDRKHLGRAAGVDASCCDLLHPVGCPNRERGQTVDGAKGELAAVRDVFARSNIEAVLVDLTRPETGIPVVHAVAPALQIMPGDWTTERLHHVLEGTGGGRRWTNGAALF